MLVYTTYPNLKVDTVRLDEEQSLNDYYMVTS
jgi:hypothetical protein